MARTVARSLRAAALPQWVPPQLTKLVDAAPDGPDWLHEIKYDGYRMHARLDRGAVKLLMRTGLDWTHKYPAIAKAVAALDARQAYLDDAAASTVQRQVRGSSSRSHQSNVPLNLRAALIEVRLVPGRGSFADDVRLPRWCLR